MRTEHKLGTPGLDKATEPNSSLIEARPKTARDALYEMQRRWIEVNGYDPDQPGTRFRDPWYMCPVRITECECGGEKSFWFRFVKTDMYGRGGDQGEMHVRAHSRREATFLVYDRVMSDPAWGAGWVPVAE